VEPGRHRSGALHGPVPATPRGAEAQLGGAHVRHLLRRAAVAAGRRGVAGAPCVRRRLPAEGLHQAGFCGAASRAPVRRQKRRRGLQGRAPATGGRSLNWQRCLGIRLITKA